MGELNLNSFNASATSILARDSRNTGETDDREQEDCDGQAGSPEGYPSTGKAAEEDLIGLENESFFIDLGSGAPTPELSGIYVRASDAVVGQENEEDSDAPVPKVDSSRCFNCGSPDHVVNACPSPFNRALVSLSRQYYTFFQALNGVVEYQRIHIIEQWRRRRLGWLDTFEPGEVRGPDLLDALGGQEGDWLANMAAWGYPRGWTSVEDPRERVRRLIMSEHIGEEDANSDTPFFIYGDDDPETLHLMSEPRDSDSSESSENEDDTDDASSEGESSSIISMSSEPSDSPSIDQPPKRWAHYPPTHFASPLLPIYTGIRLPPISFRGSATYTPDRHELWHRIVSGSAPAASTPPWRLPGAFGARMDTNIEFDPPPPPPSTEPPPLPPPPPTSGPPPLPLPTENLPGLLPCALTSTFDDPTMLGMEEDMDMSD